MQQAVIFANFAGRVDAINPAGSTADTRMLIFYIGLPESGRLNLAALTQMRALLIY